MSVHSEKCVGGEHDRRLDCRIGDFHVSLQSDLKEILEDFARIYPGQHPDPAVSHQTIRMEVRRAGRGRLGSRRYRVLGDGEEIGGRCHAKQVFPFLEWGINLGVIAGGTRYLQLHAASLVRFGKGFIFAGASGCGKSTLAAGLLARGWGYLCDELALVDPDLLCLHLFPKALCIKAGSFPCLRRLGLPFARCRDYIKGPKGRVGYINPRAVGPHTIADPAPIRFVIFPKYTKGKQPRLDPIPRGRALVELAGCALNRYSFGARTVSILAELVRGAEVFRLESGNLEEACKLLERRLCRPTAQREGSAARLTRTPLAGSGSITSQSDSRPSRREMLRSGAKLTWIVPAVLTLSAPRALAAGSHPSAAPSCAQAGDLCETDTDCCSGDCDLGICQ